MLDKRGRVKPSLQAPIKRSGFFGPGIHDVSVIDLMYVERHGWLRVTFASLVDYGDTHREQWFLYNRDKTGYSDRTIHFLWALFQGDTTWETYGLEALRGMRLKILIAPTPGYIIKIERSLYTAYDALTQQRISSGYLRPSELHRDMRERGYTRSYFNVKEFHALCTDKNIKSLQNASSSEHDTPHTDTGGVLVRHSVP